jgi:uncharacterized protein
MAVAAMGWAEGFEVNVEADPPRVVVAAPSANQDDAFFWEGVREGRLLLRSCAKCGWMTHPPLPMCAQCGSTEWETLPASGRGVVHSWIVSRHPGDPNSAFRLVALVELEEGVRMVSNLVGVEVSEVINDMPVEACFVDFGGVMLPQFRPRPGSV